MNNEEKARAYDEALERARKQRDEYQEELDKTDKDSKLASILRAAISAIELAYPELAESEDERMLREIKRYIKEQGDKPTGLPNGTVAISDMIAWLEKQKETGIRWFKSDNVKNPDKPHIDKTGMFYTTDGRMCYASEIEKQKEQKHPNGCFTCDEYKKGYEEGRRNGFTAGYNKAMKEVEQKEQKPWEWGEEETKLLDSIIDDYEAAAKSFCGYDGKIGLLRAIRDGEYDLPKQEWIEEDEKMLKAIDLSLNCYSEGQAPALVMQISRERDWIKSLSERFNLQPKQEWIEEDEKMWMDIKSQMIHGSFIPFDKIEWIENRLKSLRPSWKPSEEQMEALYDACCIAFEEGRDFHPSLSRLHHDLRKL